MAKQTTNKPKPHYTQPSEPGNSGHSGLPIKSDGNYRDVSDLKQPAKPVGPQQK